ncbi:MAG: hypothetical protein LBG71_02520 [Clostridiales Family XIII bacterium]|jgi:hypothetical protein|nr:hypothetical protein [Clostridiales Family XIII bacterium]
MIERVKSIAIVVLVLNTILLLYFYWSNPAADVKQALSALSAETPPPVAVRDILRPERITLNFGGENYTVFDADAGIWESVGKSPAGFIEEMRDMASGESMALGVISRRDYGEVMKARSIQADFAFSIPFSEYCAEYGLTQLGRTGGIDSFTTVAYSTASPESFFVCDKLSGKYYRLSTSRARNSGLEALISRAEGLNNASYYPLRTYAGIDNDVMLPLDMKIVLPETSYRDYAVGYAGTRDGDLTTDMARAYFGESFDFTRKLTEADGSIVYMYRYGEKVLSMRDGVFEYNATADAYGSGGFFQDLRIALDFLARCGAPWRGDGAAADRNGIYLKAAGPNPDNGAYRFLFGLTRDGWRVSYENSEPFLVEVRGQRATYARLDLILCSPSPPKPLKDAAAPFDVLVANYAYIFDDLAKNGPLRQEADISTLDPFTAVMERTRDVRAGYLRPDDGSSGELAAVWVFDIDGLPYYFNLYSGEIATRAR